MDRNWAQPVIRECAQFPNGEYDDWVDTVTQAIIWLRKTYHLEFKTKTTIRRLTHEKRRNRSMAEIAHQELEAVLRGDDPRHLADIG